MVGLVGLAGFLLLGALVCFGRLPLSRPREQCVELFPRAACPAPIGDVPLRWALGPEGCQVEHAHICGNNRQADGHVLHVLAASIVVVANDDDVGALEIGRDASLPSVGTTAVAGADEA